jgi:Holliday junction DNA helicase RuvA
MIGRLAGQVIDARPDELVLDVGGVGYRVKIPLSTFYRLAEAREGKVALHVHTHVREDAIQLFGFWTEEERTLFERLIAISGVGPRIALAVLSGVGVGELESAVRESDRSVLERIPGIGRKTAERVLLELKDRVGSRRGRPVPAPPEGMGAHGPEASSLEGDATSALINLGYSESSASAAVSKARRALASGASIEDLLRATLRVLVR